MNEVCCKNVTLVGCISSINHEASGAPRSIWGRLICCAGRGGCVSSIPPYVFELNRIRLQKCFTISFDWHGCEGGTYIRKKEASSSTLFVRVSIGVGCRWRQIPGVLFWIFFGLTGSVISCRRPKRWNEFVTYSKIQENSNLWKKLLELKIDFRFRLATKILQ